MERPKQRRHRCKDPTKLDINSLTGEERVPVVHKDSGRRVKTNNTFYITDKVQLGGNVTTNHIVQYKVKK